MEWKVNLDGFHSLEVNANGEMMSVLENACINFKDLMYSLVTQFVLVFTYVKIAGSVHPKSLIAHQMIHINLMHKLKKQI